MKLERRVEKIVKNSWWWCVKKGCLRNLATFLIFCIDIYNKTCILWFAICNFNCMSKKKKSKKTGQRLNKAARERKRRRFLLMTPGERKRIEREKIRARKRKVSAMEQVARNQERDANISCFGCLLIFLIMIAADWFVIWSLIHRG